MPLKSLLRFQRRNRRPEALRNGQLDGSPHGALAGFPVDDVAPAPEPLSRDTLARSLDRRLNGNVLRLPDAGRTVIGQQFTHACHALIECVHTAFSRHYPLVLSPDSVWLVIAQGFGHHISRNEKVFRGRLVRHQGRHNLCELVPDLSDASVECAIAGLCEQIREATDPVLHETLMCDFTTTTPAIRTAGEVVLMDAYSSYFTYEILCICGIPWIALTGSAEDWRRIRARVEVLETFELGWWVARLRPILDEFVRTGEGNPDREFWRAIYKPEYAYATEAVTGWIADLFPYLGNGPKRRRNPVLFRERDRRWAIRDMRPDRADLERAARLGVSTKLFPSGLSSVPLKLSLPGGSARETHLVAGYLGVGQDPATLALSPVIGWCLTE